MCISVLTDGNPKPNLNFNGQFQQVVDFNFNKYQDTAGKEIEHAGFC